MARTLKKSKGRSEGWSFDALPRACVEHSNYISLPVHAKALLIEMVHQYRGGNNGDLSATWNQMAKRGWKSRDTLGKALTALEDRGWLVRARQGGKNFPTLYALTFHAIDDCRGKLDVSATHVPLHFWKLGANPWKTSLAKAA